eukprot:CAMPEP_0197527994 /NCGR_PEP_ID=MMETSP1318-20131121/23524_1 /TAXON_ID=552666 /ORGANISM="Partenskyella glossopodia, Strain RCC365" /LENGTH=310 /DNA_ID=CAMNT_0043082891 /DNA_START=147 /DNA_END=1079 /DNA_ORIENTATION=-
MDEHEMNNGGGVVESKGDGEVENKPNEAAAADMRAGGNDGSGEKGASEEARSKEALEDRIRIINQIFREQEYDLVARLQRLRMSREATLKELYADLDEMDKNFPSWQQRYQENHKWYGLEAPRSSSRLPAAYKISSGAGSCGTKTDENKAMKESMGSMLITDFGRKTQEGGSAQQGKLAGRQEQQQQQQQQMRSADDTHTPLGKYFYKSCAVVGNRYFSIFDGETEYISGSPIRQRIPWGAEDTSIEYPEFVYSTAELAKKEKFPSESAMLSTPRVVIRCVTSGKYKDFGSGCYLFENLAPKKVVEWYTC